jgi:ASC-1-like (ASCH) protein
MIHELKTHPEPFQAVLDGTKRFEFRVDDRMPRFKEGDTLRLREWAPMREHRWTGRQVQVRVTYLLRGPEYGIPFGYVCMSIEP